MFLRTTNCYKWRHVSISDRSNSTHIGRRTFARGDVEGPNVLFSMLLVEQIPFRLLLAQSYSLRIKRIDNFMFREIKCKFIFGGRMSFGTYSEIRFDDFFMYDQNKVQQLSSLIGIPSFSRQKLISFKIMKRKKYPIFISNFAIFIKRFSCLRLHHFLCVAAFWNALFLHF